MAKFSIRLVGATGSKEIQIDARDELDARRRGSTSGRVIAVKKMRSYSGGGLSFSDRQIFFSRLSGMISSGVGEGESLRLIHATFGGSIKAVAYELLLKVEAGATLADAVEQVGKPSFPEEVSAMIKSGSHSGNTATALRDTMNFEREIIHVKRGASKGLWSAILTFLVAAVLMIGTAFWVAPAMLESDLVKMANGKELMSFTVSVGRFCGFLMGGLLAIFLTMFFMATAGRRIAPLFIDSIILKIPLYKDFVLARTNFISFYALSMLVGTGVRMEHAFQLMARTTPPGALRRDFTKASEAVRSGRSWATALSTLHPTDRAALASSLDRDQVSKCFSAMSETYRTLYANRTEALVMVLKVIAMVFLMLAGYVLFDITCLKPMQMSQKFM